MKKVWVTSDHHFSHTNIIKYSNRPFSNVQEMNEVMFNVWNSLVSDEDIVFHLGDIALCRSDVIDHILHGLKGQKILITGNHDSGSVKNHPSWVKVKKTFDFEYLGTRIHMQHYPWQGIQDPRDLWLHGHSHGNLGTFHDNQIDMSVENWNYCPVLLEELLDIHQENVVK